MYVSFPAPLYINLSVSASTYRSALFTSSSLLRDVSCSHRLVFLLRVHSVRSIATLISLPASTRFFLLKHCSYHDTNHSCLQGEEIEQTQRSGGWRPSTASDLSYWVSNSKQSTAYLWFIDRNNAKQPIATVINGLCVPWGWLIDVILFGMH